MNATETLAVVTGGQEFFAPGSSQGLRMAEALGAAGCAVLYFECGGDGRLFGEKTRGLREVSPGVFAHPDRKDFFLARSERLPLVRLSWPGFARRVHCRRTTRTAERFLASPAAPKRGRLLAIHYGWFFPELFAGSEAFASAKHVYECLDDHTASLNIRGSRRRVKYVLGVERRLLERADLSVFSSPFLLEARSGFTRRGEVIPLGVEAARFAPAATAGARDPHEARGIGRPRVGFIGQVTGREDWDLVARAAEMTPEWEWVVVGPLRGVTPRGPEHLHWIGEVPHADVPAWLAHWDAAFVPLADIDFNRASWPLKFYECLAAGLAVASTPVPAAAELEDQSGELVVPAEGWGPVELVAALNHAMTEKTRARAGGPAFAARHTWEERARRILELVG